MKLEGATEGDIRQIADDRFAEVFRQWNEREISDEEYTNEVAELWDWLHKEIGKIMARENEEIVKDLPHTD